MRWLWPTDRAHRMLLVGAASSVLLHVLLVALALLLGEGRTARPVHVKRGEPLLVDLAPERPEDKAPTGNPARHVGPDVQPVEPTPPAPKAPPPPAPAPRPRVAQPAPRPPDRPAPPTRTARAEPPAPAPPGPAPAAPEPSPPRSPAPAQAPAPDAPDAPTAPAGEPRVALSRPQLDAPPSIFRRPQGGGGLSQGRGGVEGEPIPLDTPEPKYQDYFNKIRQRIRDKWIYPREAGDRGIGGQLLIEFHIGKDGTLRYLELRRSSGVDILDEYAMNAVRLASPFPPVPDQLAKAVLPVSGLFRYEITSSFVNQFIR